MKKSVFALSMILTLGAHAAKLPDNVNRIAFGSCNSQHEAQPLWKDVIAQKPDLWIWTGDAVYGDWKTKTTSELEAAFNEQLQNQDYQAVRSQIPIIGIWDDHDYAFDNAEGDLAEKEENQRLYLNFIGEPENSPRRSQEGINTSYTFNSQGHKVKVIMLDNRYWKNLEAKAPILGEGQWRWFEDQIKDSDADVHLIVSGLSVFSPIIRYTEEWADSYYEVDRMLALMEKHNPKGRVFLTGDMHFSALFQRWGETEFLSSGMTHLADSRTWWYLARKYDTTFFGLSYGQIDFNWEGDTPVLSMSMRTTDGRDAHPSKLRWTGEKWHWFE